MMCGKCSLLLSAQRISSTGEFVCVSQHTKRLERSTACNLPPIFAELATTVVSQEKWSPIALVEIRNAYVCRTESGINFYRFS